MQVTRDDGEEFSFTARCRIDTYNELEYFRSGGILHYVLRKLAAMRPAVTAGPDSRSRSPAGPARC